MMMMMIRVTDWQSVIVVVMMMCMVLSATAAANTITTTATVPWLFVVTAWGGSRQKTEWARPSMEGRGPSRGHSRPGRRGRPVPLPMPPPVGSDGAVVSAGRENRLPTAGTMRQLHAVSPCRVSDVCLFIRTFWAYTAVLFFGFVCFCFVLFAVSDTGQQVIMIKNKWYTTC